MKPNLILTTLITLATFINPSPLSAASFTLKYTNDGFIPSSLTAIVGDSVIIKNLSGHNLNLATSPNQNHPTRNAFNLGLLPPHTQAYSHLINPGTHLFYNQNKPEHIGSVTAVASVSLLKPLATDSGVLDTNGNGSGSTTTPLPDYHSIATNSATPLATFSSDAQPPPSTATLLLRHLPTFVIFLISILLSLLSLRALLKRHHADTSTGSSFSLSSFQSSPGLDQKTLDQLEQAQSVLRRWQQQS